MFLTAGGAIAIALAACGSDEASAPGGDGSDAGAEGSLGDGASTPSGSEDAAGSDAGGSDVEGPPPVTFRWVADALKLPVNSAAFALDLNGDGSRDNLYGALVSFLLNQGLDGFAEADKVVADGDWLQLFALATHDAALGSDPHATVDLLRAQKPVGAPDFTGAGTFTIDPGVPGPKIPGALGSGAFATTPPAVGAPPPVVRLKLWFGAFVDVDVMVAQVRFRPSSDALAEGTINGAIRGTDIQTKVVPAMAQSFDAIAKQIPCSEHCTNVRNLMDTNADGNITTQEVADNPLMQALIDPDLEVLDAQGNWNPKPNPATGPTNGYSVAVGFTAVKASF